MSFDINPLGPQMHLKQIERDARQQQCFENTAEHRPDGKQPATRFAKTLIAKTSIAWLVAIFTTPRHAS
jgi:hypothetical protein